jgi:hypothetical protein
VHPAEHATIQQYFLNSTARRLQKMPSAAGQLAFGESSCTWNDEARHVRTPAPDQKGIRLPERRRLRDVHSCPTRRLTAENRFSAS